MSEDYTIWIIGFFALIFVGIIVWAFVRSSIRGKRDTNDIILKMVEDIVNNKKDKNKKGHKDTDEKESD